PHDGELAAKADVAEAGLEALYVAADLRADVGVDHGGRHALELAVLAQDLVRQRHVSAGQELAHDVTRDALVLGIDIGVQEAHGRGFDAFGREAPAGVFDAGAVEWLEHLARAHDPLFDLAREMPRYERPVPVEK